MEVIDSLRLYMKSVQMRSFFWSVFPAFGLNTERYSYLSVFSLNVGKHRPQKTLHLDTFHTVKMHMEQVQKP